jgi:3-oxoacyl-[acyl-carrier protein] reductase
MLSENNELFMRKKTVLITGATGGIGFLLATHFAENGWRVIAHYFQSKKQAMSLKNTIEEMGGEVLMVRANVASKKEVKKMANLIKRKIGHVDCLINNAGAVYSGGEWQKITEDKFYKTIGVNTYGVLNVFQEIFPLMKKGVVVNISSLRGLLGAKDVVSYAAAKAGVTNLTKSLAKISAPNIRVNCLAFGRMNIGLSLIEDERDLKKYANETLVGRVGKQTDITNAIDFFISQKSSFMTGQTMIIDGGASLIK